MLRLLLLLLTPLWLSLAVDRLGLAPTLPASLSGWRRASTADTTVAPPSDWREKGYLAANPDVAAAVRNGEITSGYTHYVQFGRAEGRVGGLPGDRPLPQPPAAAAGPTPPAAAVPAVPPPPPLPAARMETADAADADEPPLPAVKPLPSPVRTPQRAGDDTPHKPLQTASARPAVQQVQRIRTAHSETGVRVVLDIDQPPRFQAAVARPDGRVMVPLPGTRWLAPASGFLFPSALEYRLEQSGADGHLFFGLTGIKGTVRLVGISTLPPDKERGHRLVIDLALPAAASR